MSQQKYEMNTIIEQQMMVAKKGSSRLISMSTSYRKNWAHEEATRSLKTNTDLIHSSSEETGIKPPSILGDCDTRIKKH